MIPHLLPETATFLLAVLFLLCSFGKASQETLHRIGLVGTLAVVLVTAATLDVSGEYLEGSYRVDLFSQLIKLFLGAGAFLTIFLSDRDSGADIARYYPEYLFFLLASNLGMMMLSSATEFIGLMVALELSSFSLYVLTGLMKSSKPSIEAGMKYLLSGGIASAFTLYGFSLLFAYFGDTGMPAMAAASKAAGRDLFFYAASIIFMSAFFFKLAIQPFSFWAPDVYSGGSTPVVNYIATVSKIAGVAVMMRIFSVMLPVFQQIDTVFIVIAVITMTYGNLTAVHQTRLKRIIAYSSIAQAGYMLVGIALMQRAGWGATLFYVLSYLVMNFTFFLIVDLIVKTYRTDELTALRGLSTTSPLLAMSLLVTLLSLGGVPPFVGFTGKWFIFTAAISKGLWPVVLIAFLNSVVSVYYYLLIARQAYLFEPEEGMVVPRVALPVKVAAVGATAYIVVFGINPAPILSLTENAVRLLIGA